MRTQSAAIPRQTIIKLALCLSLSTTSTAFAQRGVDAALARHWDYDAAAAPAVKETRAEPRAGGVVVHDLSYSSPIAGRAARLGPNAGTVPAYLVLPTGAGPFPAVIYAHWCMQGSALRNRNEFLEEALLLARSGVASLLPENVSVRPGFVADDKPLNLQQIDVLVQEVTDLRRGADLLLARKDIDRARLAYVGHSCGGEAGAFVAGLERRFKAFVIMAGGASDEVMAKTKGFQDYRRKVGAQAFDAFMRQYSWADAGRYVSRAAPAFVFMQYATDEPQLPAAAARDYFARASQPKRFELYEAPHALNAAATRDRIVFLAGQLGVAAPDAAAVAKLPTLPQPPWPKNAFQ